MDITSPLNRSNRIRLEKTFESQVIIDGYKKTYGVDVGRFFDKIPQFKLYTCIDTGYQFFYPFTLAGDSQFYEALERFPWYYMRSKWEHRKVLSIISKKQKILEVGCGNGAFLETLVENGFTARGLELNQHAVEYAKKRQLDVRLETIENHAEQNREAYDVVCSFQVLEHIADINGFISGCIKTLKKGGLLIISVPNDESFLHYDSKGLLNIPPHHMGLWNGASLKNLEKNFTIKFRRCYREPLQPYHLGIYYGIMWPKAIKKIIPYRLGIIVIRMFRYIIKGHTIVATFTKLS